MNVRSCFISTLVLSLSPACAAMAIPTPQPSPTMMPTATPNRLPTLVSVSSMPLLPKPEGDRYAPPNVPACQGAKLLDNAIKFAWENSVHSSSSVGFSNVPENQWTYYRCDQSLAALFTFYKESMPKLPYKWLEIDIEVRSEGTLAVYHNNLVSATHGYRWVYLWFFPVKSDDSVSNLVAAWWDAPHTC